ncbi:division/cell wall cluster transcriptional repressor MraZ [bacterium]|nr:division/cell wall cluster transcriptional repressor MraZ [bacterium]
MFLGTYTHTVDEKGRLSIPSRFRDVLSEKQLPEKVIVTQGLDACLVGYPVNEWKIFQEKIVNRPMNKSDDRYFIRRLLAGATECTLDKQGRIMLPAALRNYAGVTREAVVVGVSNRIEIWSPERWEKYLHDGKSLEEIAEQIEDL